MFLRGTSKIKAKQRQSTGNRPYTYTANVVVVAVSLVVVVELVAVDDVAVNDVTVVVDAVEVDEVEVVVLTQL